MITKNFEAPSYEPNTLLHLCRHFNEITDADKKILYDNGFSLEDINNEIKLQGSKFYNPPFDGINSLISYIKINWDLRKEIIEKENIYSFKFIFDKNIVSESGIGNDGLVKISDLPDTEKKMIYSKDRKGIAVNTYPTNKYIPTFEFVLIAKLENLNLNCITIYPGTYAPPFPNPAMPGDFLNHCREFWENHALVEMR